MTSTGDAIELDAGNPVSAPHTPGGRRVVGFVALSVAALLVVGVYVHSSWSYRKSLDPVPGAVDFQNRLADAFLAGQVSLKIEPPRGLLKLRDPYDPNANAQYRGGGLRLHDLSLYRGKLYAYFGPSPVLLLFIPFRALHVGSLSPTLACFIFCLLGFVCSVAAFWILRRALVGRSTLAVSLVAILGLGLAVPAPFIVYVGRTYEVEIACGYFLVMAGVAGLSAGLFLHLRARARTVALAMGSLALGLAIGARPPLGAAAILVAAAVYWLIKNNGRRAERYRRDIDIAALVVPFLLVCVLLALYNWVRFHSPAEFGNSYQLLGENVREFQFWMPSSLPRGLYYYLLAPMRLEGHFPYLHLLRNTLDPVHPERYTYEPVAGVLTNMPLGLVCGLLTATRARELFRQRRVLLPVITALELVALMIVVATSWALRGATMRYTLDFAPLILLGALLGWAWWMGATTRPWARTFGLVVVVLALGVSVAFSLAITAIPCAGTGSC